MLLISSLALGLVNNGVETSIPGQVQLWDNETYRSAGPGDWSIEQCTSWRRPHHLYFQLANAFFFLAFLAPNGGTFGMLWLRCALLIGCVFMGIWGWIIDCTMDVIIWTGIFFITNIIYLGALLIYLRPVKFDNEIEAVSNYLFNFLLHARHLYVNFLHEQLKKKC